MPQSAFEQGERSTPWRHILPSRRPPPIVTQRKSPGVPSDLWRSGRRPPPLTHHFGVPPRAVRGHEAADGGEGGPRVARLHLVLRDGLRVPPRHVRRPQAGDAGAGVDRSLADDLIPPGGRRERRYAGDGMAAFVADVHWRVAGEWGIPGDGYSCQNIALRRGLQFSFGSALL